MNDAIPFYDILIATVKLYVYIQKMVNKEHTIQMTVSALRKKKDVHIKITYIMLVIINA